MSPKPSSGPAVRRPRALLAFFALALFGVSLAQTPAGPAVLIELEGPIGPATSDFVMRSLETAAARNAEVAVLQIDTPGGLDSSMRDIIKAILASPVPVVGFVAPEGAHAASAGTYILYATHVAAMSPATNLGAATPVPLGGERPAPRDGRPRTPGNEADGDETAEGETPADEKEGPVAPADASKAKVVNDAVAYIRSLAERRGRNADWAEEAVRQAASLSAEEALALNVIDLMAGDVAELLREIDGRTVQLPGGERELATAGLMVERLEPDWRTEILQIITNPQVALLLVFVGIYGLLFEGYNPGAIVPGVVGAISLLLAAYALQILPVNYAGLALMALGVALMIAEIFAPSFGVLGLGGVAAFVVGAVFLMDTDVPGFGIPLTTVIPMALVGALVVFAIVWVAAKSRFRPVVSGIEEMVGMDAEAVEAFEGSGQVMVHGEIWNATTAGAVSKGQRLKVTGVDGLTLSVDRSTTDSTNNGER
jgi:membrane-bound serine protease (ClpP class)